MMSKAWYAFRNGDPKIASNYLLTPELFYYCLCGERICAIYADKAEEGEHPKAPLSIHLQAYIDCALVTGALQPEKPAGAKKHVYLGYK